RRRTLQPLLRRAWPSHPQHLRARAVLPVGRGVQTLSDVPGVRGARRQDPAGNLLSALVADGGAAHRAGGKHLDRLARPVDSPGCVITKQKPSEQRQIFSTPTRIHWFDRWLLEPSFRAGKSHLWIASRRICDAPRVAYRLQLSSGVPSRDVARALS